VVAFLGARCATALRSLRGGVQLVHLLILGGGRVWRRLGEERLQPGEVSGHARSGVV
jgi:hypothetical protein